VATRVSSLPLSTSLALSLSRGIAGNPGHLLRASSSLLSLPVILRGAADAARWTCGADIHDQTKDTCVDMGIGEKGKVSPILTQLTKDYQANMKVRGVWSFPDCVSGA
jgi:hypothetical protein